MTVENVLTFVVAITPLIVAIIGIFTGAQRGLVDRFAEKRRLPKNYALLEKINRIEPARVNAEKHEDVLAQDIVRDERIRIINQFSKAMSLRYISVEKSNTIMFFLLLAYTAISYYMAYANPQIELFWLCTAMVFCFGALVCMAFVFLGLPFWAPIKTRRGKRFSKKSEEAGMFLWIDHAANLIVNKETYCLVDARPYSKTIKIPLADAVRAFNNPLSPFDSNVTEDSIENLIPLLPDTTQPILVCSEFGVESQQLTALLREKGYVHAYDLGAVATRNAPFQRLAFKLHYLQAEKKQSFLL